MTSCTDAMFCSYAQVVFSGQCTCSCQQQVAGAAATNQDAGILPSFIIYTPRLFIYNSTHISFYATSHAFKVAKDGAYSLNAQKTKSNKMDNVSPINILLQNRVIAQVMGESTWRFHLACPTKKEGFLPVNRPHLNKNLHFLFLWVPLQSL